MTDTECIFCKILRGELPCAELYSDEKVFAFLDIAPVNQGHALVIPRGHYPDVFDVPPETGAALVAAKQKVGKAIMAATGADGLNIYMNNGAAAGQIVYHAHWHLIPRFTGDGLSLWPQKRYNGMEEMLELATAIREHCI